MSPDPFLNYSVLGLGQFQVFPLRIYSLDSVLVDSVLEKICEHSDEYVAVSKSEFWLLKEPIPFDQVDSNPWLLDNSANLTDYATRIFHAEKLSAVWTNLDHRSLHAVVQLGISYKQQYGN